MHGEYKKIRHFTALIISSITFSANPKQIAANGNTYIFVFVRNTRAMPTNGLDVHKNEECTKAFHGMRNPANVFAFRQRRLRLSGLSLVSLTGRTIKRMWRKKRKTLELLFTLAPMVRQPWRLAQMTLNNHIISLEFWMHLLRRMVQVFGIL